MKTLAVIAALLGLGTLGFADAEKDLQPTGRGAGTLNHPAQSQANNNAGKGGAGNGGPKTSANGIVYHGGPVMTNGINIYYIWYGNWAGNTAVDILTELANNIGGSPYFNINTTYADGAGNKVINSSGLVRYAGSYTDPGSLGTSLSDANLLTVISKALNGTKPDPNGVYFVLGAKDVKESSGFCSQYCGFHSHATINGVNTKYSFVGNPEQCPSACTSQTAISPNGNVGADGMASVLVHELEEAATDPDLNAWYDSRGAENADKCAWTFGTVYQAANGSRANMKLGTRDYLIQQNWVNAAGGYCALTY